MFPDVPEEILGYYAEKARDLPQPAPSPVHELIANLDRAVVANLNLGGSQEAVNAAFEAVLAHPENTWKREVLSYRLRVLHYS